MECSRAFSRGGTTVRNLLSSSLCFSTLTMKGCTLAHVKCVLSDSVVSDRVPAAAPFHLSAVVLQLFNEVQERAIEEQMAAVKDVVMEPTMKTLSDDLVGPA